MTPRFTNAGTRCCAATMYVSSHATSAASSTVFFCSVRWSTIVGATPASRSLSDTPSCPLHRFDRAKAADCTTLGAGLLERRNHYQLNPFIPKSDQYQISPAASPEILHHTVWRTWLFIAYSDARWLYYQLSLPSVIQFSLQGWENAVFELGSESTGQSKRKLTLITPKFKKYILPTFQREMYKWGSENW